MTLKLFIFNCWLLILFIFVIFISDCDTMTKKVTKIIKRFFTLTGNYSGWESSRKWLENGDSKGMYMLCSDKYAPLGKSLQNILLKTDSKQITKLNLNGYDHTRVLFQCVSLWFNKKNYIFNTTLICQYIYIYILYFGILHRKICLAFC